MTEAPDTTVALPEIPTQGDGGGNVPLVMFDDSGSNTTAGRLRNTHLTAKAIMGEWPVPEKYLGPLITRQIAIALDPKTPIREANVAFKSIVAALGHNLKILQFIHDVANGKKQDPVEAGALAGAAAGATAAGLMAKLQGAPPDQIARLRELVTAIKNPAAAPPKQVVIESQTPTPEPSTNGHHS